jgi:peptidyl-prolyl cis-trans isomerase B (cyclophilin B)
VLQGGDPAGNGSGGPGFNFADENLPTAAADGNYVYPRGTVAMANSGANTNGSQFFLVYKDSQLPPNYTVFGTIDGTGLATLDKIAAAGVTGGAEDGKPATEVKVTSVLLD